MIKTIQGLENLKKESSQEVRAILDENKKLVINAAPFVVNGVASKPRFYQWKKWLMIVEMFIDFLNMLLQKYEE